MKDVCMGLLAFLILVSLVPQSVQAIDGLRVEVTSYRDGSAFIAMHDGAHTIAFNTIRVEVLSTEDVNVTVGTSDPQASRFDWQQRVFSRSISFSTTLRRVNVSVWVNGELEVFLSLTVLQKNITPDDVIGHENETEPWSIEHVLYELGFTASAILVGGFIGVGTAIARKYRSRGEVRDL